MKFGLYQLSWVNTLKCNDRPGKSIFSTIRNNKNLCCTVGTKKTVSQPVILRFFFFFAKLGKIMSLTSSPSPIRDSVGVVADIHHALCSADWSKGTCLPSIPLEVPLWVTEKEAEKCNPTERTVSRDSTCPPGSFKLQGELFSKLVSVLGSIFSPSNYLHGSYVWASLWIPWLACIPMCPFPLWWDRYTWNSHSVVCNPAAVIHSSAC